MSKRMLALSVGVLVVCGVAIAQVAEAPKPGAEHKAMEYFAGKWQTEGEIKPSPFGPGGKMTSQDVCELFDGGFQVVCRGRGSGPAGPMSSLGILAYDAAGKAYTYYGIDNAGTSELSAGNRVGKTWVFTAISNMAGHAFNSRYIMVESSPTSYTYKWETSPDGEQWTLIAQGRSTKSGS
ncbi:MAG TPA: DUF1579 family protein [Steroidobacteraceae bacterium]|jgi:hypothetical protein